MICATFEHDEHGNLTKVVQETETDLFQLCIKALENKGAFYTCMTLDLLGQFVTNLFETGKDKYGIECWSDESTLVSVRVFKRRHCDCKGCKNG
jgi:hypothetical protein